MIDIHAAMLTYLNAASPLRTLLGANRVYVGEIPGGDDPSPAIVFRVSGGRTEPMLYAQQARVSFRCYGSSAEGAYEVYRALYDRLHMTQNFIVGDVGFHGASESVPGEPLEDARTGWPFVFTTYNVWVATVPVSGGVSGGS